MPVVSQKNQDALTQAMLKSLLKYDPETGKFLRKVSRGGNGRKYSEAGTLHHTGYVCIRINGYQYRASRLAFLYMTGEWPDELVDHANRDRSDDRWRNLRECTYSENNRNASISKNSTSGVTGVSFHKLIKKWQTRIVLQGRSYHLGYFDTIKEAAAARAKAAAKYHGEFAADHSQAVG